MKLKLKPDYLEWSVNGGGKSLKRKLKNVDPSEYKTLYDMGYVEFFEVEKPVKKVEPIENIEKNTDDTNK